MTTDFFAWGDTTDHFGLLAAAPDCLLVEMDHATDHPGAREHNGRAAVPLDPQCLRSGDARGPAAGRAAHASRRHLRDVRLLHHGWLGDHLLSDCQRGLTATQKRSASQTALDGVTAESDARRTQTRPRGCGHRLSFRLGTLPCSTPTSTPVRPGPSAGVERKQFVLLRPSARGCAGKWRRPRDRSRSAAWSTRERAKRASAGGRSGGPSGHFPAGRPIVRKSLARLASRM
jgi:hypothetical protein